MIFLNNNLFNIAARRAPLGQSDVKENFGNGIVQYKDITIEFDKFDKQYFKSYYRKSAVPV